MASVEEPKWKKELRERNQRKKEEAQRQSITQDKATPAPPVPVRPVNTTPVKSEEKSKPNPRRSSSYTPMTPAEQQKLQKNWQSQINSVKTLNIPKRDSVARKGQRKSHSGPMRIAQMKFILLGESGVGKTAIISRYVDKSFSDNYNATVGIDFKKKESVVDGSNAKMEIWDTGLFTLFISLIFTR